VQYPAEVFFPSFGIGAPGLGKQSIRDCKKGGKTRGYCGPTRSIGFARDADVIIASATLLVTLIWIKHREIESRMHVVFFANGESR